MITVASDLYPLIYDFLIKCGHSKSGKVFLKDINKKSSELKSFDEDLVQIYSKFIQDKNLSTKKKRKLDEVELESEDIHADISATKKSKKDKKKGVTEQQEVVIAEIIEKKQKKVKVIDNKVKDNIKNNEEVSEIIEKKQKKVKQIETKIDEPIKKNKQILNEASSKTDKKVTSLNEISKEKKLPKNITKGSKVISKTETEEVDDEEEDDDDEEEDDDDEDEDDDDDEDEEDEEAEEKRLKEKEAEKKRKSIEAAAASAKWMEVSSKLT